MARPSLVDRSQILDVARQLAWERGTGAVAIKEVALRLGRPSGSLYYRFPGRDHLLAEMWLEAVEHFQEGYITALGSVDAVSAARAAASHVLKWSVDQPQRAHILLWFQRTDLLGDEWPVDIAARAGRTERRLAQAIDSLAARLHISSRRLRMAIVEVPHAVVRRGLDRGGPTEEEIALVDEIVSALLSPKN